jgi:hypothetical protein
MAQKDKMTSWRVRIAEGDSGGGFLTLEMAEVADESGGGSSILRG